ncbi:DUF1206 domain-containing protein [Streptomyces sp. NPDC058637]|uniref:DUF1206 domain-containing protein n=1 Tax=Streptomyces sp. NPDC058637 TaxID=3346569 RepID=UPI00364EC452
MGTLGEQPFGQALVWVMVVGPTAMALWRPAGAAFGQTVRAATGGAGVGALRGRRCATP